MWSYAPVAVRLVSSEDLHGLTGIHLVREGFPHYIITFNYLTSLHDFSVIVSAHVSKDHESVPWYPAKIHQIHEILPELAEKLGSFKKNGFKLIPHDIQSDQYQPLSIAALTVSHSVGQKLYLNGHYRPLDVVKTNAGESLDIISHPFTFNNSLLFSNFLSRGTVNYLLGKKNSPVAYFVDVRYMENMIGGVAQRESGLVGLVLGTLKKSNGDGDLLVVVPWNYLGQAFGSSLSPNKLTGSVDVFTSATNSPAQSKLVVSSPNKIHQAASVLPIKVIHPLGSSWGSCVYYNSTTFVTNLHVVKPFLDNPTSKLEIHLHEFTSIDISKTSSIFVPTNAVDLAFISIEEFQSSGLGTLVHAEEPGALSRVAIGDVVTSYGYGLFFNPSAISPLISTGIVNTILSLPSGTNLGAKSSLASMIITSSACWNGSSGGGLFNSKGRLLGLICSNAQVSIPSLEKDTPSTSIKVPQISFVLPIDLINYCYSRGSGKPVEVSSHIRDLWQLKKFHEDVMEEQPKL